MPLLEVPALKLLMPSHDCLFYYFYSIFSSFLYFPSFFLSHVSVQSICISNTVTATATKFTSQVPNVTHYSSRENGINWPDGGAIINSFTSHMKKIEHQANSVRRAGPHGAGMCLSYGLNSVITIFNL